MKTFFVTLALVSLIALAALGLFVPIMHAGHGVGAPAGCFFGGGACGVVATHVGHWLSSFAMVLTSLFALAIVGVMRVLPLGLARMREPRYERFRVLARTPRRPVLYQELCSDGIMHPKVRFKETFGRIFSAFQAVTAR